MRVKSINFSPYIQFSIILFFILIFFKNYIDDEGSILYNILSGSYVVLGAIISFYYFVKEKGTSLLKIILGILIFSSLFTAFIGDNYRLEDYILSLCYFGLGIIPLKHKLNYKIFLYFSLVIIFFFGIQMFSGLFPDEVFPRVSRNFISVLLLIGCSYHFISSYQNERRPLFLIIMSTLILSIWATGRAGIISAAILLLFYPITLKVKNSYKVFFIIIIILLSIFLYFFFENLLYDFGLGRFKAMGLDSDRNTINADYFKASFNSFRNLIFGAPFKSIPSIIEVELNPHNAFIRLHAFYGLFAFVIIIIMIISSFIGFLKNKNYLFISLFLSLLIRSYLDSTAFHGPLDPILYFLIFFRFRNTIVK